MMKTLVALALAISVTTAAAQAAVEGQLAGNWKSSDGTVLQIKTDGSYNKLSSGRIVETGSLTALDGKWNLRSSAGKLDSGTFSIIGGALTLRSSVVGTTSWSRTTEIPTAQNQPSPPALTANSIETKLPATAKAPALQSGVTVNSQQTSQGIQGGIKSSYPAPVAVQTPIATGRGIKGGLKSFASALQQATEEGYDRKNLSSSNSRYDSKAGRRNFGDTTYGVGRLNFNQPSRQGQGAPDPFLMKGGAFRDPGDGHGTYSAMKKNWEQQQLSSLPPAKPIPAVSDETQLYGVPAFEKRALGPAVPFRIKFLGLE
jgi:hypothetical protein